MPKIRIKSRTVKTDRGKGEYEQHDIRVPPPIVDQLPDDATFSCVLTVNEWGRVCIVYELEPMSGEREA